MSVNINRNTKVFFSTIDLSASGTIEQMNPSNTFEIAILDGGSLTQSENLYYTKTLDVYNRSQKVHRDSINPVDWSFTCYLRPTIAMNSSNKTDSTTIGLSNKVTPVADWFLWQALVSDVTATSHNSVWVDGGVLDTADSTDLGVISGFSTNFAEAQEYSIYFSLDKLLYQVKQAVVNRAEIDLDIKSITKTTWAGYGTSIIEITDNLKDAAVSVFGGYNSLGLYVEGNPNHTNLSTTGAYHPFNTIRTDTTYINDFVPNRIANIIIRYEDSSYSMPILEGTFSYSNNINYLSTKYVSKLNLPIDQYTGSRAVEGSIKVYLKTVSSDFMHKVYNNIQPSTSRVAEAYLQVGTDAAIELYFPAIQIAKPQINTEDVFTLSIDWLGQEPKLGQGGEVILRTFYKNYFDNPLQTESGIPVQTEHGEVVYL